MMQIAENLYIGAMSDLRLINSEWACVHACKTAHSQRLGYSKALPQSHPNYVMLEENNHLYVNWVDTPQAKYFDWPRGAGVVNFERVLDFIDKWRPQAKVLVHCDQGQSRAPSVGLLYLAKRLEAIPAETFDTAQQAFIEIYPGYQPSGIADFLRGNWGEIS